MLQSESINFKKFRKAVALLVFTILCTSFLSSPSAHAAPGDPASINLSLGNITASSGSSLTTDNTGGLINATSSGGTSVIYRTINVTATHYNSYSVKGQVVSTTSGIAAGNLTLSGTTAPGTNQTISLAPANGYTSAAALPADTWGLYWGSGTITAPSSSAKINPSLPTTQFTIGSDSTPNKDSTTATYTLGAAAHVVSAEAGKYSGSGIQISVTAEDIPYYHVSFDVNSLTGMASITSPAAQNVYRNSSFGTATVTLPTISDTNNKYKFDGWCTTKVAADVACTKVSGYTPSGDNTNITLYAKWLTNVTVTINVDGGSLSGYTNPQTVVKGTKITLPTDTQITKSGSTLDGWCVVNGANCTDVTDADNTTAGIQYVANSDVTIKAKWGSSANYMHEFTSTACNNITTGATVTLTDKRDGKQYLVSRLKDNRCWMVQNLALGSSSAMTLTSELSNVTATRTLPASTTSFTTSDYDTKNIYVGTHKDGKPDHNTTNRGTYYSYSAATLGTQDNLSVWTEAPGTDDVCPKKWHLPSSTELYDGSTSVKGAYGSDNATFSQHWQTPNYSGTTTSLVGYYSGSSISSSGSYSGWWAGRATNILAYRLYLYSSGFSSNDYVRYRGLSVRCVFTS